MRGELLAARYEPLAVRLLPRPAAARGRPSLEVNTRGEMDKEKVMYKVVQML